MGMTIDEALKVWLPIIQTGVETMPECKEALDMAIDAMRKYQKIVQIMERTVDDGTSMYDTLQEIEEVIEDGTID